MATLNLNLSPTDTGTNGEHDAEEPSDGEDDTNRKLEVHRETRSALKTNLKNEDQPETSSARDDTFDELLPEGSQLVSFSEDASASSFEGLDLYAEEWYNECLNDDLSFGCPDVQVDISEYLNVPPETETREFQRPVTRSSPNGLQLLQQNYGSSMGGQGPNAHGGSTSKKNYTNRHRWEVYNALLERSVRGRLGRNVVKEVANLHSMHIRTVQRIWKQAKGTPAGALVDVSQKRKNRCGRKRIQIDLQRVLDIPLRKRTTLRTLAEAIGVSHSTLFKKVKEGLMRRHSNALKPHLKEENKVARLRFCMNMLDPVSLSHEPQFIDMYNIVHIDEKWFYMTKRTETYYLLPEEDDPIRTCQSKNFIGKVMVLVAMARPRFNAQGVETFSGKIGVFPFITRQPAQRRSRNREAGTIEIKPLFYHFLDSNYIN